jgi:hypothetical protein
MGYGYELDAGRLVDFKSIFNKKIAPSLILSFIVDRLRVFKA